MNAKKTFSKSCINFFQSHFRLFFLVGTFLLSHFMITQAQAAAGCFNVGRGFGKVAYHTAMAPVYVIAGTGLAIGALAKQTKKGVMIASKNIAASTRRAGNQIKKAGRNMTSGFRRAARSMKTGTHSFGRGFRLGFRG